MQIVRALSRHRVTGPEWDAQESRRALKTPAQDKDSALLTPLGIAVRLCPSVLDFGPSGRDSRAQRGSRVYNRTTFAAGASPR